MTFNCLLAALKLHLNAQLGITRARGSMLPTWMRMRMYGIVVRARVFSGSMPHVGKIMLCA